MMRFHIDSNLDEIQTFERLKQNNISWRKFKAYATWKLSNELTKETRKRALIDMPRMNDINPRYSDKMIDAIRIKAGEAKHLGFDTTREVHVFGTRDKTSGTYRLRFYNQQTKSPRENRGSIKSNYNWLAKT